MGTKEIHTGVAQSKAHTQLGGSDDKNYWTQTVHGCVFWQPLNEGKTAFPTYSSSLINALNFLKAIDKVSWCYPW